ncbi:MAG: hypothetical protein A2V85_09330 [Chloroflexi bacterium RBG_16_72_14]|nr:MAG: hypothetical protein A2V85_09330 [Chloroflexi bacterium RBG_16_72_14]
MGALDDPAEREADRVADAVSGGGGIAEEGDEEEAVGGEEPELAVARSPAHGIAHDHALAGGGPAPASVASVVGAGGGRPLEPGLRDTLEARLGTDLGPVRVHTDARAAASAAAIGARAYTLGSDVVFGAGQYAPHTGSGLRTLAHELAHVVQQRAAGPAADGGLAVRRTSQVKIKVGKGKKARKMTIVVGGVEFSKNAKADVLKSGGLLPGPDQAHIAFHGNKLAYDLNYATPQDPFRWNQIKELIDSDERIKVDKVDLTDNVKVKFVTATETKVIEQMMLSTSAAGLTLPTESRMREIYPNETTHTCSPHADAHQIYYTAIMSSSAARSELAHELLGHMWLAIKKVPFVHPTDPKRAKAIGTLSASHGIQDPLGKTFVGTVEDYIRKFVSSQIFAAFASPTQFVSPAFFSQSLADFKAEFAKGAVKNADASWKVSPEAGLAWEKLSNNYRFADPGTPPSTPPSTATGTTGTASGSGSADAGPAPAGSAPAPAPATPSVLTQAAVITDLTKWQGTLKADQKFVLEKMLDDIVGSIDRITDLAKALRKVLKP